MSKLYALILVIAVSWLIILEIERRGKLGAERHIIFLLFKTEKGKAFISKIAMHRRFWKVFASVGIAVGILGMFAVVYLIAFTVYSKYVLELPTPSGVMAVIPGVTIPFWYGMLGLMTVLVVHELSHGIVARSENVSLKSLGIVFLTIIPIGAFVEPDEKELKSKSRIARLRVYAVGSFGNILLALVGALIIFSFLGFFYDLSTVQVSGIVDGAPAEEVLEEGMILKSIDGKDISSNQDFSKITKELEPNKNIVIETDKGSFSLVTIPRKDNPKRGFIGIQTRNPLREGFSKYIYFAIWWVIFLNQGIGLINLAPLHFGIAATDGHHIVREILSRFIIEADAEKITVLISTMTLAAIILTVI